MSENKPKIKVKVTPTTPVGRSVDETGGWIDSVIVRSECWLCGTLSARRKPGAYLDLWVCTGTDAESHDPVTWTAKARGST